ncbi:MAG: hypothetical protein HGA39_04905 [Coriobacteriia bacterium]|nr:hypothetical protein [Coriobacteriia bacterium]
MMAQPKLLVLWAELNAEMGNVEDALSRCRAAKLLAEHDGDVDVVREALALSLVYLRQLNRKDEAKAFAEEILASHHVEDDKALLAQTLVCLGYNRIIHGEMVEAKAFLDQANEVVSGADFPGPRRVVREAIEASSIVSALAFGDFNSTVRILGPLIGEKQGLLSSRVTVRGNVAVALAETGRLDRCEALLRAVVQDIERNKLDLFAMAFYPALGCALAARGAIPEAIGWFREAIRIAIQSGDEPDVASARVYLASILRAAGDLDESLIEAERAFEHLSMSDYMAYRRLAALEVAASLLALGDPSAARAWTESVAANGFQGNRYHALRADMILAEIERRDGELDAAVARLATHRDYVLSENPNWQIAMYCRAFPALLGMFALAVGSKCLPSHMLRMIPPEHAERILLESRCFLDDATWEQLGLRLLGESEFRNLLARGGLPLCHVRLFGGLEVSIGGNTIRERDWKKRKARLLFTMLVVRRGHDIPRDQICEHLWPEMEEERAVSNLYVIWSTMKTTLGGGADKNKPSAYVESVGGVCRIVRDRVRSDVDDFEESLQRAREAEAANDAKAALRAYERIGDIYRGDLLPGDCYDDWFANLREHYRTEFVDAMQRAAQLLVSRDDPANALVFVRRAIQCDQYREDLYQSALRCQIAAGQRSSAIDTYLQCRDRLSDELGLDPSAETCALYSAILAMEARPQTPLVDPLAD